MFRDKVLLWTGLELGAILLPQFPQCWADKHVPIQPFSSFCFKTKNHYPVLLNQEISGISPPGSHQEDKVVRPKSQKAVSSGDP